MSVCLSFKLFRKDYVRHVHVFIYDKNKIKSALFSWYDPFQKSWIPHDWYKETANSRVYKVFASLLARLFLFCIECIVFFWEGVSHFS